MAESFSREKLRHAPQKEGGFQKSCVTLLLCDPAGTSNELDVQNEWEENTRIHTYIHTYIGIGVGDGNGDGNGDVNGHGDGDAAGTGTGVEVNEGAQDGDGSEDGAGTGTGVGTRRRTSDGKGDDDNGNEGKIGEGGREAKKRKKPKNSCRRRAGNGEDTGGQRKKCRKDRVGSVAANPDNLEINKEAGGEHKVLRAQVGIVQVERACPLCRA